MKLTPLASKEQIDGWLRANKRANLLAEFKRTTSAIVASGKRDAAWKERQDGAARQIGVGDLHTFLIRYRDLVPGSNPSTERTGS